MSSYCRACSTLVDTSKGEPEKCPSCNTSYWKIESFPKQINQVFCRACNTPYKYHKAFVIRANAKCEKCGTTWKDSKMIAPCGCGRHSVLEAEAAKYKGDCWDLRCLFYKVDKRMPKILQRIDKLEMVASLYKKMRLKFIKMKKYMKLQPCSVCGYPAGNRFSYEDGSIICGKCKKRPS